jgi:hypothetical protein
MAALQYLSVSNQQRPAQRLCVFDTAGGSMSKDQQFSEFEAYLKDRQWRTRRSQSEIEKVGTKAALVRCRELARQIQSDLLKKSPDDFVDLLALADFQVSIERAASVLAHTKPTISPGSD